MTPHQDGLPEQNDWQHLKPYGYAPGNYMIRCRDCNDTPIMDKRASRCRPCAEAAYAKGMAALPLPVQGAGLTAEQMRQHFEWWWTTRGVFPPIGSRECAAAWSAWVASGGYTAPEGWKVAPMASWGWEAAAHPKEQPATTELTDSRIEQIASDAFEKSELDDESPTVWMFSEIGFIRVIRSILAAIQEPANAQAGKGGAK